MRLFGVCASCEFFFYSFCLGAFWDLSMIVLMDGSLYAS